MIGVGWGWAKIPTIHHLQGCWWSYWLYILTVSNFQRAAPSTGRQQHVTRPSVVGFLRRAGQSMDGLLFIVGLDCQVNPTMVAIKKQTTNNCNLDEFSDHLTASTKDALGALGCHLVNIQGGYTWRLQVMDVGLNRPFKDFLRNEYDCWQEIAYVFDTPSRT
jgi:hypothetical protein